MSVRWPYTTLGLLAVPAADYWYFPPYGQFSIASSNQALALGLFAFNVEGSVTTSMLMAGSLLMITPVIIIFFFAQKYFIQGVTLTGMKG